MNTSHRGTMLRSLALFAAAALVAAPAVTRPALAQSAGGIHPGCAAQPFTEDACQLTVDVFRVTTPLIANALAGGAPITEIGNGGQRFRLGLRMSAVSGFYPDLDQRELEVGPARSTTVVTEKIPIPVPTLDLSAQLFGGIPLGFGSLGFGRVASVSALASMTYLPDIDDEEDFAITTEGSGVKFGFGGRVGIVEGLPFLPDLSASWERRALPTTSIAATTPDDSLSLSDLSLSSQSIRVVAAKRFPVIGLTAGWGQDRLGTKGTLSALVSDPIGLTVVPTEEVEMSDTITLSRYFAGLSVSLGPLGIGAEVGQVSGSSPATYNSFDGADDSRLFGTVTLRLAF